jgi:hypothetical protein
MLVNESNAVDGYEFTLVPKFRKGIVDFILEGHIDFSLNQSRESTCKIELLFYLFFAITLQIMDISFFPSQILVFGSTLFDQVGFLVLFLLGLLHLLRVPVAYVFLRRFIEVDDVERL